MNSINIFIFTLVLVLIKSDENVSEVPTTTTTSTTGEIAINNHNTTENSTSFTSDISEVHTTTENQLKITTMSAKESTTEEVITSSPYIDVTTLNHQQQQQQEDVETTISFGIRSFTVEVSKSDKLLTSTAVPMETLMPTTTTKSTVNEIIETTENPHPSPPSIEILKSNLNILFNDDSNHENEISNEIQIDKKLDNGLYRIKIGEITTDEFAHEQQPIEHHMKVNIDDFFPSKIEDFRPLIEISNEKMLKEKDQLHSEQVKTEFTFSDESESTTTEKSSGTRINTSNVATTNIEIELIDETTVGGGQSGIKIDEIITQVEEIVTEVPAQQQINPDDSIFIPRRTKKFDPSMSSNTQGPTRIHDFGMTKFNQQKKINVSQNQVNGKPEYSTTKFYNSKELYNEILHKTVKTQATTVRPPQATIRPAPMTNFIREKLLNTNKIPIESHIATTIAEQPVLTTVTSTITEEVTTTATSKRPFVMPTIHPRILSRLEEKLNTLDCDIQNLSADSTAVWRGNETHELNLPITVSFLFLFYLSLFPLSLSFNFHAVFSLH